MPAPITFRERTKAELDALPKSAFLDPDKQDFPIMDDVDLKAAIHAYGRADNQAAAKQHIISRAKAIGKTSLLPDGWMSKSAAEPSAALLTKIMKAAVAGGWADELPDDWKDPDGDGDDDRSTKGDTDHDFHKAHERQFAGRRHNMTDQNHIQSIHDHSLALGAESPRTDALMGAAVSGQSFIPDIQAGQTLAYAEAPDSRHAFLAPLPEWFTEAAEPPAWIPYMPAPHNFTHPVYGSVALTPERNAEFVTNFNQKVYQDQVPLDSEHETKLGGALGWIRQMRQNDDGSVDARVDWTPRGTTLFQNKAFKYVSPEWYDEWTDPANGQTFQNVAIGGALTTRPFFKPGYLRPLAASEHLDHRPVTGKGDDGMANETVTPAQFTELREKHETLASQFTELQQQYAGALEIADGHKAAAEKMATDLTAAQDRVTRLENEARTKRFAELATQWPGDRERSIARLGKLAERFGEDSEEFKEEVAERDALAATMKQSGMFQQVGSGARGGGGSAETELEGIARGLMATEKIPYGDAYQRALTENPAIYQRYVEQTNRVATSGA